MATFSIELPDDQVQRVTDALCEAYGYQPQVADEETGALVDNPQSQGTFAHLVVANFIRNTVAAVEADHAAQQARDAAAAAVHDEVTIQ